MDGLNINPWINSYCSLNNRQFLLYPIDKPIISKKKISTPNKNPNKYISYKKEGELLYYFYKNSLKYKHFK